MERFYIYGDEGAYVDEFDIGEAPTDFMAEELGLEELYTFEFAYSVVYDYLREFYSHEEAEANMADYFGDSVDSPYSYKYAYKIEGQHHQYVTEAGLEEYIKDKLKAAKGDFYHEKITYREGQVLPFPYM